MLLFFTACKEKPIVSPEGPRIFDRVVLVEEFTGVQCTPCAAASAQLESLSNIYPDNMVVVAIHAGELAPPYPNSNYDLRTEDGDNIMNYLGEPYANPSAVFNRKSYEWC